MYDGVQYEVQYPGIGYPYRRTIVQFKLYSATYHTVPGYDHPHPTSTGRAVFSLTVTNMQHPAKRGTILYLAAGIEFGVLHVAVACCVVHVLWCGVVYPYRILTILTLTFRSEFRFRR